jgi:hypothetical protein
LTKKHEKFNKLGFIIDSIIYIYDMFRWAVFCVFGVLIVSITTIMIGEYSLPISILFFMMNIVIIVELFKILIKLYIKMEKKK